MIRNLVRTVAAGVTAAVLVLGLGGAGLGGLALSGTGLGGAVLNPTGLGCCSE